MKSEKRVEFWKALLFAVLFVAFSSIGCASATTYTVCPSGCDHTSIQAAIDAAADPGDTIEVHSGTYNENVNVNKHLILRGVDTGGGKPVVDAGGSGNVIALTADGITLEGFTATNSGNSWEDAGIKVTSTNNTITGNNASCSYNGIRLDYSSNNTITGNNVSNNEDDIYLCDSSNNTITGNNVSNNNYDGVCLWYSSNNTITSNTFVNDGLFVSYSYQNTVEDNTINGKPLVYLEETSDIVVTDAGQVILVNCNNITVENQDLSNTCVGIELWKTGDSIISNNTASNNIKNIYLYYSSNNTLRNNLMSGNLYNFGVRGSNIITGNTASNNLYGRCPICIDNGIYLSNSNNNTIAGNTFSNHGVGIQHTYSCNNSITGNNVSNNEDGLYLCDSSDNTIIGNTASSNNYSGISLRESSSNAIIGNIASDNRYGIRLYYSSNNTIYLNNFINNTDNVYSSSSSNIWNSTEEISYTYNGSTYTNYTGNYWDDYIFEGNDTNSDGIGDTSYVIPNDNNDNYPLMEPWENYFAPTGNIFDTEATANPYPCIMGTHNGTITPSHNLTVSKLYTYPCAGTGGHTESIELYDENDTLVANGSWNGYIGDYHNITIHNLTGEAPYVTLLKNHEYRYVIKTGSYPQIIHEPNKNVTGGTITCDHFIDANGKIYTGWIPAIRLWAG